MNGPRAPQTDLRMEWQHWVAPVLEGTEIQGFHIISLSDYFQEKVFPNQRGLLLIHYFFFLN